MMRRLRAEREEAYSEDVKEDADGVYKPLLDELPQEVRDRLHEEEIDSAGEFDDERRRRREVALLAHHMLQVDPTDKKKELAFKAVLGDVQRTRYFEEAARIKAEQEAAAAAKAEEEEALRLYIAEQEAAAEARRIAAEEEAAEEARLASPT